MYLVKTPRLIQSLFPRIHWRNETEEPVVHLTFDDGPIPEVTPWVLDQLGRYQAKATFFCVGHNIEKHPDVFARLLAEGHLAGNHTYHHLDGWSTDNRSYFKNIRMTRDLVGNRLFRPPYGHLRPSQAQFLQRHYQVVLWDILSGDFDRQLQPEDCLRNVLQHVRPGSIIVLHDNIKSFSTLRYVLPRLLESLSAQGYRMETVPVEQTVLQPEAVLAL